MNRDEQIIRIRVPRRQVTYRTTNDRSLLIVKANFKVIFIRVINRVLGQFKLARQNVLDQDVLGITLTSIGRLD